MFFAGVIFARSFRDVREPDQAFGSNIAGAVVGGFCENFSMLLGFRNLLLLAALFYIEQATKLRRRRSRSRAERHRDSTRRPGNRLPHSAGR
jgi:hypothetical protein